MNILVCGCKNLTSINQNMSYVILFKFCSRKNQGGKNENNCDFCNINFIHQWVHKPKTEIIVA